jgi:TonB family protein
MRFSIGALAASLTLVVAATAAAQGNWTPPRLVSAAMDPAPWNVQGGGIAACEAKLDARGRVTASDVVQDLPPYGATLCDAVRAWLFDPATLGGQAVASRALVLGFFRPPATAFAAPDAPRYKTTAAPEEIPWPTSVAVPPYPPNALGSGMVVLEADVSDRGAVTRTRVLSAAGAFDSAAADAVQKWVFRPARYKNRDVPSRAFLVMSFVGTTP